MCLILECISVSVNVINVFKDVEESNFIGYMLQTLYRNNREPVNISIGIPLVFLQLKRNALRAP